MKAQKDQKTGKLTIKVKKSLVRVMGHEVREGSAQHDRLMQDKKNYDDNQASEIKRAK